MLGVGGVVGRRVVGIVCVCVFVCLVGIGGGVEGGGVGRVEVVLGVVGGGF